LNKTGLVAVSLASLLFCTQAFAQGKKAMFFEAAIAPADSMFSTEPSGYSKLVDALTAEGTLVASMSSGEITRQKLSPYEIVVLHPSPERPFDKREISALVWFVAQKGGALFVHGGNARIVNPLTEIFGISMDAGNLVDTSSSMGESVAGREFALTRFPSSVASGFEFPGVQSIGFYGGPSLVLSLDAIAVVTGDEDCYSDSGFYSIGSYPPVAAAAYLGRGVIFVKSDRTMLSNANIEARGNLNWAKLLFESLSSIQETGLERESSLLGLRSRLAKFSKKQKTWAEERVKTRADLTAGYKKVKRLKKKLEETQSRKGELAAAMAAMAGEKDKLEKRLARYESPDTLKFAAVAAGAVLLMTLVAGFLLGRRSLRGRV
jgi:hypothetical protein